MIKRSLFLFLAILLLLSCFPQAAIEALATPETHPNTYKNTGDQRADLIGVALTQIGYYEGPNNDTKYGAYFNLNYHAWCGLFVSWCAVQAGIPDDVMVKTGIASPQAFGLSQHPYGYKPKSGDLYFTPNYSHVGIVYFIEGDYFYSLEGNTWDASGKHGVYMKKKLISDVVFATPKYKGGGNCSYTIGYETAHPHKEYKKCEHCGDFYYTGNTRSDNSCTTCIQQNCSHSYSAYIKSNDATHYRSCTLCGKTETGNHNWNSGTVIENATCKSSGLKKQVCTVCGAEKNTVISKLNDHSYGDWVTVDEEFHKRICSVCKKEEKEKHDLPDKWQTDDQKHWKACEICDTVIGEEEHSFGESCESPCDTCAYVREGGHPFLETWSTDADKHWKDCKNCSAQQNLEEHHFDAICDEICDTCGFTRSTEHTFTSEWVTDEDNHWIECFVCGLKKENQAHDASHIDRKGAMQYCTVCDLRLTSDAEHIHGFDDLWQDDIYHYGICSCGIDMKPEAHVWMQNGTCLVCGAVYVAPQADYSDLLPWAAGAGGAILLAVVLLILCCKNMKRKK